MWSIAINRFLIIVSVALCLCCESTAHAAANESEAKVVANLYKDYAWQAIAGQSDLFGGGLGGQSKASLEKYFASDLAKLLAEDSACQVRTREICNLDFDLLFDSQDPRVTDLEVEKSAPGKVRVQFKDPVTDETTRIEFKLAMVSGKWRITDIIYRKKDEPSLKSILSQKAP